MKYNRIIGIDVGLSGGIALFDNDDDDLKVFPMPKIDIGKGKDLYIPKLKEYLFSFCHNLDMVVIEKQQPFYRDGSKQAFSTGQQYGIIQGICHGLELPYIIVRPQEWKKLILKGYDTKDKASSVRYVQQKYPHINLLPTVRCRKPSDGMADAVCIAEYGLRVHAESGEGRV